MPGLEVGQQVIVTQQIPQRSRVWTTRVQGEVVSLGQKKTGSWYAHARDDRLWLDRLTLRKADGEIVVCHLDPYSRVEVLPAPSVAEPAVKPASAAQDTATPATVSGA